MGRPRKVNPLAADQQLRDVISQLDRSGASKWFFTIRKKRPGAIPPLWSFWQRNVPVESIDDVTEFCHQTGGTEYEYKVRIHDQNGQRPVGPDGNIIADYVIPSLTDPVKPKPLQEQIEDPILEQRRKDLNIQRQQLDIERQEADLARQRKELEKMKGGNEDDEEDDGEGYVPPWGQYGYPVPGQPYYGPNAPPPHSPWGAYSWWAQQQQQPQRQQQSELAAIVTALAAAFSSRREESASDLLLKLMPLLQANGFKPSDMVSMFSPFVQEMSKINTEASKVVMTNLAESDKQFRERVLDLVMASGAGDDDIERWRRILGLVTETGGNIIRTVLGRSTIAKGGEVTVPVMSKPKAPGLPASGAGSEKGHPQPPSPNPAPPSPPQEESPGEKARRVIIERIRALLLAQEQEMLVGSDPVLVAEKVDELWLFLPETLRGKLEEMPLDKLYEELRSYDAEIVDRILKSVAEDAAGVQKKWCITFWEEIRHPSGDDGDDEEGDEGSPEPEPDPAHVENQ